MFENRFDDQEDFFNLFFDVKLIEKLKEKQKDYTNFIIYNSKIEGCLFDNYQVAGIRLETDAEYIARINLFISNYNESIKSELYLKEFIEKLNSQNLEKLTATATIEKSEAVATEFDKEKSEAVATEFDKEKSDLFLNCIKNKIKNFIFENDPFLESSENNEKFVDLSQEEFNEIFIKYSRQIYSNDKNKSKQQIIDNLIHILNIYSSSYYFKEVINLKIEELYNYLNFELRDGLKEELSVYKNVYENSLDVKRSLEMQSK